MSLAFTGGALALARVNGGGPVGARRAPAVRRPRHVGRGRGAVLALAPGLAPASAPGRGLGGPGAGRGVLIAVGVEAIHVFTVYFLGPKLVNATELYGVVGVVSTILFWFYLTGRLVIGAATLNASLYEQDLHARAAAGTRTHRLTDWRDGERVTPAESVPTRGRPPALGGALLRVDHQRRRPGHRTRRVPAVAGRRSSCWAPCSSTTRPRPTCTGWPHAASSAATSQPRSAGRSSATGGRW